MNQQEVVSLMESSTSEKDWNDNCLKVAESCGSYPEFWHSAIISSGLIQRVFASFGSSADLKITTSSRRPIQGLYKRPNLMPHLAKGEKVVGVYDQGLGKKDMYCDSLEEMQNLYDSYYSGMALTLDWFIEIQS